MNLRVVVEYDTEVKAYASWCPELPGCTSCGDTETEAVENIKEAIELYLEPDDHQLSADVTVFEVAI
jgi:predicted RNase H-like HicB family nuclease